MGRTKFKKSEIQKVTRVVFLVITVAATVSCFMMGCQSNLPAASDETVNNPCPTPVMFNNCQSLTANGNWNSTTTTTFTSSLAPSPYYATAGTYSLDAAITSLAPISGGGYDQNWLQLSGFKYPVTVTSTGVSWHSYPQMIIDMTVDQSVVAGASYSNFTLIGSTGKAAMTIINGSVTTISPSQYYSTMSTNSPVIVAGTQSVTLDVDLTNPSSTIPVTDENNINLLYFVYSRSAPSGSQGTGNIYIGDIRLTQSCP